MSPRRVVVDGSNIATEGRSTPSLAQLDEAIREFQREHPDVEITVVVDASFGHRIDESERALFEEALSKGEIVSPPAGAIGRGDAFLLRIAERTGAMVLSNDSFQEFHGEHDWLFTKGRLIGGKPVPGVGWIFTPRTPVRGPRSREAVSEAKRTRVRIGSKEASQPMPVPKVPPPGPVVVRAAGEEERGSGLEAARVDETVREAIEAATEEVVSPESSSSKRRRRRRSAAPPQAVNDPLTFITFIADHPLGSELEGEVESFTSHGAFVLVDGTRCYIPLSGMGDPPPRRARQVLAKGERRRFVLQALDPQRRGVELALPGFARVAGAPSAETVKAEIAGSTPRSAPDARRRSRRRRRSKRAGVPGAAVGSPPTEGGDTTQARPSSSEDDEARHDHEVPAKKVASGTALGAVAERDGGVSVALAKALAATGPAKSKRAKTTEPIGRAEAPEGEPTGVDTKPQAPAKAEAKKAKAGTRKAGKAAKAEGLPAEEPAKAKARKPKATKAEDSPAKAEAKKAKAGTRKAAKAVKGSEAEAPPAETSTKSTTTKAKTTQAKTTQAKTTQATTTKAKATKATTTKATTTQAKTTQAKATKAKASAPRNE